MCLTHANVQGGPICSFLPSKSHLGPVAVLLMPLVCQATVDGELVLLYKIAWYSIARRHTRRSRAGRPPRAFVSEVIQCNAIPQHGARLLSVQEEAVVQHTGSCYVLGRSGTG